MNRKQKKSQVTIFLILGIVILLIFVVLILVSKHYTKKKMSDQSLTSKQVALDLQKINYNVKECLSIVSKEGLKKIGDQGGYLFTSQGGTLLDYHDSYNGMFFIKYSGNKVVYNILKPRFTISKYFPEPPEYPWVAFPYERGIGGVKTFNSPGAFGTNAMPPLTKTKGHQSMQEQLEQYVKNNIDNCLKFSEFEEQGYKIYKKEKDVEVNINEDDVMFKMSYPIFVESPTGEKTETELKDFQVKHGVRLGKIYRFVNELIESDINDVTFDISQGSEGDFTVRIERDVLNYDDLLVIIDKKSNIDGLTYNYFFARKNRNPALYCLWPEASVTIGTTITREKIEELVGDFKAEDPDEDEITDESFSIYPPLDDSRYYDYWDTSPSTAPWEYPIGFSVTVTTDGDLTDYQGDPENYIELVVEGGS